METFNVVNMCQSLKGKFHDHFFWRKAQNLRAEKVLGMHIEILIFATKKIALRSTHWRNFIFMKNCWRRYFCIFQNQNKMEIQNTQPEQNCMDLLAAAYAYVYRDEAMPSTGGFLADLRHVEDNYLEGTLGIHVWFGLYFLKKVFPLHLSAPFFSRGMYLSGNIVPSKMSLNLPFILTTTHIEE